MASSGGPILVQKFGGTSLSDSARLSNCADRVAQAVGAGHRVVVVVSAMGKTTDQLVELAHSLGSNPDPRGRAAVATDTAASSDNGIRTTSFLIRGRLGQALAAAGRFRLPAASQIASSLSLGKSRLRSKNAIAPTIRGSQKRIVR